MAMLDKQWWKIIHNSQSLCFKDLKMRYISYSGPMSIPNYSKGSYLWSSLMDGRKIIEERSY